VVGAALPVELDIAFEACPGVGGVIELVPALGADAGVIGVDVVAAVGAAARVGTKVLALIAERTTHTLDKNNRDGDGYER